MIISWRNLVLLVAAGIATGVLLGFAGMPAQSAISFGFVVGIAVTIFYPIVRLR